METKQIKVNPTNDATKGLIEAAFTQIALLGSTEQASRLFPDGLGTLELQVALGSETQRDISLSLKISGQQAITAAPLVIATANGDVEATFNAEGHHIVAFILRNDLNQNHGQTMQRVQEILDRGGRDLLSAATFPDDIRSAQPATKPFHFIDIPFEQGGPPNPPLPGAPNVITKIAEFTHKLQAGTGTDKENVDALSRLIHLFGDIHQPLHCIERISQLHPGGDGGGNSFRLSGNAENLHKLWDSSANFHNGDQENVALEIMETNSRAELAADLENTNVESWARASFALAKKFAYGPLHENPAHPPRPSAAYLKQAEKTGRRQAALAAYRLADRLRAIFA